MTHEDKHYVEVLQQRADKPKEELMEILEEMKKIPGTKQRSEKLETIISRLSTWQQFQKGGRYD